MAEVKDGQLVDPATVPENQAAAIADESFALALRQSDATALVRRPSEIMRDAIDVCHALLAAISKKKNKLMMNDEQYIDVDDWVMVAGYHGCTPKLESDEYVEYGEAQGWEATVVLIARDGREVGRATMMCLNDEEKWSDRPKYEWCNLIKPSHEKFGTIKATDGRMFAKRSDNAPNDALVWEDTDQDDSRRPGHKKSRPKAERLLIGTERVPMFQLRSMAQTRATGKVCRMAFGYVPMLGGLKATPAEELADMESVPNTPATPAKAPEPARQAVQPAQDRPKPPATGSNGNGHASPPAGPAVGDKVNPAQVRAFWTWAGTQGVGTEDIAKRIRTKYGHASSNDLTNKELDELKAWIKDPDPVEPAEPGSEG